MTSSTRSPPGVVSHFVALPLLLLAIRVATLVPAHSLRQPSCLAADARWPPSFDKCPVSRVVCVAFMRLRQKIKWNPPRTSDEILRAETNIKPHKFLKHRRDDAGRRSSWRRHSFAVLFCFVCYYYYYICLIPHTQSRRMDQVAKNKTTIKMKKKGTIMDITRGEWNPQYVAAVAE